MMKKLTIPLLALATAAAAGTHRLSFEGFVLGMSKQEAAALHPTGHWQPRGKLLQMEIPFEYMALPAVLKVTVDPRKDAVTSLGVVVKSTDAATCIPSAERAYSALAKQLGDPKDVQNRPMKKAMWTDSKGNVTMWFNTCSTQPTQYEIVHSAPWF